MMHIRYGMPVALALGLLATAAVAKHDGRPAASLLDPAAFAPTAIIAPPPAQGSVVARQELAYLRALHQAAPAERIARADADGHDKGPHAFNAVTGRDLTALPATAALLARVDAETDAVVDRAKQHFRRIRPYRTDPTLPHCGKGKGVDDSYPSGHSAFAWSTGWTLAQLMPDRAAAILDRSRDYAEGREICAVHYPSDVEAGHAVGQLVADRLLNDPRLADQVAAARAELARR
ncbi:phosphatase PAP2 family protein [uncultured Sphingomonas sp.]|uniref:phosphatase PAP2 family protein n=1 Tax=uncultured Sphingomonas sp. TaxID=158754 RepID=UPI0025E1A46D|nr:phosphatase PAP2 family protein [uncultured Sphingomonas sp.]